MNFFKKYDTIPSPYSTILALLFTGGIGLYFIIWPHETGLFGIGIAAGGFIAIALKAAAEVSDRKIWRRVRSFFGGKNDDDSK